MHDRQISLPDLDRTDEIVIGGIDDAPTDPDGEFLDEPLQAALTHAGDDIVSTTLPMSAAAAFEAFCDIEATPHWVSVVKSVKVLGSNADGRVKRAAFLARLERATIGYTLHYCYDEAERVVTWGTPTSSSMSFSGRAQFVPLGERACLLQYELDLTLPKHALPAWDDPYFSGHAASAVMNDFRDWVSRLRDQP